MKQIKLFLVMFTIIAVVLIPTTVHAASLSVRISEPKSPTYKKDFEISFVALDIPNRPVAVSCYKKGPGEGSFSQFGASMNFPAGGGAGNCDVNSSAVNSDGTYTFYVKAVAGAEEVTSDSVNVDVNTSSPGTPVSYSKEKISSCEYKIKFKTADDGGKTKRVEIYRSTETSFNLDSGSKVFSIAIGSNEEKEHVDTVPDCNKEYYYALRAFDDAGNGSGSMGDSIVKTTTTQTTTTAEGQVLEATQAPKEGHVTQGAIKVLESESLVASPTGELENAVEDEKIKGEEDGEGGVLGVETKQSNINYGIIIFILLLAIGAISYVLYRKRKEK